MESPIREQNKLTKYILYKYNNVMAIHDISIFVPVFDLFLQLPFTYLNYILDFSVYMHYYMT